MADFETCLARHKLESYDCVVQKTDDEGNLGVHLTKNVPSAAGKAITENISVLGRSALPLSEKAKFALSFINQKVSIRCSGTVSQSATIKNSHHFFGMVVEQTQPPPDADNTSTTQGFHPSKAELCRFVDLMRPQTRVELNGNLRTYLDWSKSKLRHIDPSRRIPDLLGPPVFYINRIPFPDPDRVLTEAEKKEVTYTRMHAILQRQPRGTGPASLSDSPTNPFNSMYRGLTNRKNLCFLHSVVQAIMATPRCAALFSELADHKLSHRSTLPYLYRFAHLAARCRHQAQAAPRPAPKPTTGRTWGARQVCGTVYVPPPTTADEFHDLYGQSAIEQQDAHEFLQLVLEGLHAECRALADHVPATPPTEGPAWHEVVGRAAVQRVTGGASEQSLVTDLFGGTHHSIVRRGRRGASVTVQPFTSLQVNVVQAGVDTVEAALRRQGAMETIASSEGTLTRQLLIERLPSCLVVHLSRVTFDPSTYAIIKVQKAVQVPEILDIGEGIAVEGSTARYRLYASIDHHGARSQRGHYTATIRMRPIRGVGAGVGEPTWMHFNDAKVREASAAEVVGMSDSAYMLFYEKISDSIENKD